MLMKLFKIEKVCSTKFTLSASYLPLHLHLEQIEDYALGLVWIPFIAWKIFLK